jgi:CheY-like chemotaxis protein
MGTMDNSKPVVLVVEDDAMIRIGALDLVKSAGCLAVEARDADEAIRILESRPDIRLVFTDIDMPGSMDGIKLSHFVRNRWPPIHIIVASGKAIIAESDLPSGARFFPKPYEDGPIVEAITTFFSSAGQP